jgi:hypothetical protein
MIIVLVGLPFVIFIKESDNTQLLKSHNQLFGGINSLKKEIQIFVVSFCLCVFHSQGILTCARVAADQSTKPTINWRQFQSTSPSSEIIGIPYFPTIYNQFHQISQKRKNRDAVWGVKFRG